jgi:hypothetical protein
VQTGVNSSHNSMISSQPQCNAPAQLVVTVVFAAATRGATGRAGTPVENSLLPAVVCWTGRAFTCLYIWHRAHLRRNTIIS